MASSSQAGPKARVASQAGTHTLISILQKCRQLGELEHDKTALEAQSKIQKAEAKMSLQRDSEYPVVPEILKQAQEADHARLLEVTGKAQKTRDILAQLCDKLLVEIRPRPDQKSISLLEAVGKKQEHLAHELKALQDLSRTTISEQKKDTAQLKEDNANLKETNIQLQGEIASLKQEVASSREGMAKLTNLVTTLMSKVDGIDTATTNVGAEIRQLDVRATQQSSQADAMAEKMQGYDSILAAIDPTSLEQTTASSALERADMAKNICEQSTAVSELHSQVELLQTSIKAGNVVAARIAAPAPVPAPAVFPGDDFTSVRFEIGKLGERLAKLESLPRIVDALSNSHQQAVMDQRTNTQKLLKANGGLSDVFGHLLKQETAARRKDLERVLSLEQIVSRFDSSAATAAKAVPAEEEKIPGSKATPEASKEPSPKDAGMPDSGAREGTTNDTSASASAPRPVGEASEVLADPRALQDKLTALEDSVKKTGVDVGEKYTQLRMMIATLDNQFNNLTTKDLFVAIIGQVEILYPNTRQLQQDITAVADKVRKLEQASTRAEAITPQKRMPISNTNGNARGQPADALTSKRRRLNGGTAAENE
ncbi:hypothetical protein CMQ_4503 [Grosmannia clavigera kw1407]|uniref:Uncharacterized protein n=1 Tax=Grosmannia clavigera (strain kw1407 / UAMH 11150) TaxID=655863 RepID=F0XTF7_GROCL|nr:uncharacterized protein CMQ_4503 [Grosmannia clavigera kw1407]EFW98651.1 hypothetical protein CMQ_4503 [Grosmannia clavigera kw1407]